MFGYAVLIASVLNILIPFVAAKNYLPLVAIRFGQGLAEVFLLLSLSPGNRKILPDAYLCLYLIASISSSFASSASITDF